jgi:hypothetical protein
VALQFFPLTKRLLNEMILLRVVKRLGRRLLTQSRPAILCALAGALGTCVLLLYLTLAYYLADDPRLVPDGFRHARRPMLITAHPDDETLFFSPSILYHRHDASVTRSLLVFSSGMQTSNTQMINNESPHTEQLPRKL